MRVPFRSVALLAAVLVSLCGCEAPEAGLAPDASTDAGLEIQSHTEALSALSECGDVSGLQSGAVWPMRGGCPTHAAQSEDKGPSESSENWRVTVSGAIKSAAVIAADGTVYVPSGGGKVYRFNPATGQKLREGSGFLWGGMRSTPALGTKSLFVGTDLGKLFALNPSTFSVNWVYQALSPFSASPVVLPSGDVVAASEDFSIYLLNNLNGKKRWAYTTSLAILGSPAIDPASSAIVFGSTDGSLYALNTDGNLKWKTSLGWPVAATPLISGGRVYVGAGNQLHAANVASGEIVWRTSLDVSLVGSPASDASGNLYLPSTTLKGGALFALDRDGAVRWRFDTGAGIESTPTVDIDGKLYFGTNESKVYALDRDGKLLWSRSVDGNVTASPVIVKGGHAIVVGTHAGSFYSLGKKAADECGDGKRSGAEECDTALTSLCTPDCKNGPAASCTYDEDCPNGQVCGLTNSGLFGLENFQGVCWPAFCETSPASACGTVSSPCGLCVCQPSCAGKTCSSADRNDGCGGPCLGLCSTAAICQGDSDCATGQTCGLDNGVYFGQPAGTRVCWDALCELGGGTGVSCGSLSCVPSCDGRTCGEDGCGGSCGSCQGQCLDGQCLVPVTLDGSLPGASLPNPLRPIEPQFTHKVGTLPGNASVSPSGAAEYTIPIEVPPAPGGMQPHLAFSYSSSRGNGLLGVGWSITGPELSVIARCARTSLDPGGAQPISYTAADKFCLDGVPLVEVSGVPGPAPDVSSSVRRKHYRTQLDSHAWITAMLASGSDQPDSWLIFTKDGLIKSYGTSNDSKVAQDAAAHIFSEWALDAIADRSGNQMRVAYTRNRPEDGTATLSNDILPETIAYGGFRGPGSTIAPDRYVHFVYESQNPASIHGETDDRPDVITGYRGGRRYRRSRLLSAISTTVANDRGDGTVRNYRLVYSHIPPQQPPEEGERVARPFTEPLRLSSIEVCPQRSENDGCLPLTEFKY